MSKQLKDYLHLYLGCEVEWLCISGEVGTLVGISESEVVPRTVAIIGGVVFQEWYVEDVKPLLRPLSDMTKAEMHECGNMVYDFSDDPELNRWKWSDFDFGAAEQFHYLLSKHFDLFGLIESGLAIDKTKHTVEK